MTRNIEKGAAHSASPPFHVEIDRIREGVSVLVTGVRGIRELTESTALLRLKGGFLRISGRDISATVYENKTVEVIGGVCGIEIENDKT